MHRRALLTRFAALGVLGTAGCLADQSPAGGGPTGSGTDGPTDGGTGSATGEPNGEPSTDATDPEPSADTPATPGTPPHDAPFPPNGDDVDRVVWFREVSDPDGRLHLAHSASSVELPGEVSFTLSNGTDRTFMTNLYDWTLYRWEDGWHRVAPTMVNDPLMELPPGESHTWTVALGSDDLAKPRFRSSGTEDLEVGALGGGHYAFAARGWWDDQDSTPSYEHKTVCAARVELDGDQLPLVPSHAVTGTRRDGDTVVVEADNPRSDGTPATFVLSRDEDAPDPRPMITEQVYRSWPLRDALAHATGADEVRVETTTGITPLFGVHADDDPAVEYDGRTYRLRAEARDG